jgi:hypothetical protein
MTDQINPNRGYRPLENRQQEERQQRVKVEKDKPAVADRVSLSQPEAAESTYAPSPLNIGTPYELLRSLVIKTLEEQNVPLLVSIGGEDVDLSNLTQDEAQELISEDGYFGVKKTSERIADFAINAFGQDPTRLDEMKDAITQGFLDAQEAFGGTLPEISQQTYDAIMERLDAFARQADAPAE